MTANNADSPAVRLMERAIELAIEERSPFPPKAIFINDGPRAAVAIRRAIDENRAAVLVAADGGARILRAEPVSS